MSARQEAVRHGTVISRREYLRMLVVASAGLLAGSGALASGIFRRHGAAVEAPPRRIAQSIAPGELVHFTYPGADDPAIAMRLESGDLVAYSSICPHLSCAVLWRRQQHRLECPCHNATFDESTGEVTAGPPLRPLPRIRLEERSSGIYATATEG